MATEVVKIVDPDGTVGVNCDYNSLAAFVAALPANLVSADQQWTAKCRCSSGSADTASVSISGQTTDATRYIKIWTDPAENYRHLGKWGSTKYRLATASSTAITVSGVVCKIIGIQVLIPNTEWIRGIYGSGESLIVDKCIVTGSSTANIQGIYVSGGANVRNCCVYGLTGSIGISYTSQLGTCYNNTCYNNKYNFADLDYVTMRNNLGVAHAAGGYDYGSTVNGTHSNNLSSDTSSPDSSYRSKSITFVNAGAGDLHLASGDTDAIDHGYDLSGTFTDDIDGVTRGSTWDIGADEYVPASSTPSALAMYLRKMT